MKSQLLRFVLLAVVFCGITNLADAQKRKSTKRTAKTKTKAKVQSGGVGSVDTTASVQVAPPPPPPPKKDTLPVIKVKPSLRPDEAVETVALKDRSPLAYEHLRADDAVYRHRLWREIDAREKLNLVFTYPGDEDNGNQRFIQIILKALQDDSTFTVFADDRFSIPMTISDVAQSVLGAEIEVPDYDSNGVVIGTKKMRNEVNWDSIYRFRVKEEVIFDKESSRLFWRILGIAPIKDIVLSTGEKLMVDGVPAAKECFWIYYPDFRPIFAKSDVYNGKNYGARASWEELFESRMFSGRIIQSSMDNPRNLPISVTPGLKGNTMLQLYEGENIREKIFNYEQDLWSY